MNILDYLLNRDPMDKEDKKFRKELKKKFTNTEKQGLPPKPIPRGGWGTITSSSYYGSACYPSTARAITCYPNISVPGEDNIGYHNSRL